MKERGPATPGQRAGVRTLRDAAAALMTYSFVLFITASLLQRLWVLMNSDVLKLLRRAP
jgi:hypothetical protein